MPLYCTIRTAVQRDHNNVLCKIYANLANIFVAISVSISMKYVYFTLLTFSSVLPFPYTLIIISFYRNYLLVYDRTITVKIFNASTTKQLEVEQRRNEDNSK